MKRVRRELISRLGPPAKRRRSRVRRALGTIASTAARFDRRLSDERRQGRGPIGAVATVVSRSAYWRTKIKIDRTRLLLRRFHRADARERGRIARRVEGGIASADDYVRHGRQMISKGDVDRALTSWRRAVELEPELLDVYLDYAYENWQRGRWDEAHRWYERLLLAQEEIARKLELDRLPYTFIDRDFTSVIGTLAFLDVYVKQRILSGEPFDRTILFGHDTPAKVGNKSYLDYWLPYFPRYISNPRTWERLWHVRRARKLYYNAWRCPDGRIRHFTSAGAQVERQWEAEGRPPLLALTDDHRERGRAALRNLGVQDDAWFVGLHVRAGGYHDLRNADIGTYWKAIDAVVERGGWVVRIGDREMPPLETPDGMEAVASHVVDYVFTEAWSDWMDVFILAEGRFLLGTLSGPMAVPGTFGVPTVGTNWCPMATRYWYSRDLYIPKQYWSERESRYLTFSEILSSNIGFSHMSEELAKVGVRAIDNTPEQVRDVVVEMLDRIDGIPVYTEEDERLYARFDAMEPPLEYPIPGGGGRIGRDFLRANAHLMDDQRLLAV